MKVILSHPIGNANVRAAANAFAQADMLKVFYIAISSFPGSALDRVSKYPGFSEIKRREYDPILKPNTEMLIPWMEAGRLLALKFGLKQLTRDEHSFFNINRVFTEFDKKVAA